MPQITGDVLRYATTLQEVTRAHVAMVTDSTLQIYTLVSIEMTAAAIMVGAVSCVERKTEDLPVTAGRAINWTVTTELAMILTNVSP